MRENLLEHLIVPLAVADRMALVPAFNTKGEGVHAMLMTGRLAGWRRVSPGYKDYSQGMKPEGWRMLAEFLAGIGIRSVCGQVASGSSIAFALQVMSSNRLTSSVLGKDGYAPEKHCNDPYLKDKVAIVDDIVSLGSAMNWSISKVREMGCQSRPILFSFIWSLLSRSDAFDDNYEMITVIESTEE
jgi:hypothetical protein